MLFFLDPSIWKYIVKVSCKHVFHIQMSTNVTYGVAWKVHLYWKWCVTFGWIVVIVEKFHLQDFTTSYLQLLLEETLHMQGVQVLFHAAPTFTDKAGALPYPTESELARWLIVLISHTCPREASQLLLYLQQFISEWLLIESLETDGESLWDFNMRRRDSGYEFLWWDEFFLMLLSLVMDQSTWLVVCPTYGDISKSVCLNTRHCILTHLVTESNILTYVSLQTEGYNKFQKTSTLFPSHSPKWMSVLKG